MLKKILIANRGEIAVRVIETARRMGIATVAVYADADAHALHVRMADEAVHIGASPASESYLQIEHIIDAVHQTGADAVHPGYGFLSENKKFAEALEAANITFIGPAPDAIDVMGDKITSKKLAIDAGVSTIPGYMGLVADADEAIRIARDIGYPVMIKASAGGGGKGMRIAHDDEQVREGFQSAQNEAATSFGDDRIFIEKFITQPRHIEIQILGDKHGNLIYLGERECSIQRRNQKVIEEAPSPFLDDKTRAAMGAQAILLAKAVGYYSAGTVEFIADSNRNFYFLEMNTRLQVEHPVTELITNIDLVEQMIRIADGEKLKLTQNKVKLNGWALECRIYAEDPYSGFLPSTGRLTHYVPPHEYQADGVTVRNDSGVYDGGEISIFYDPMIAKLITHAPDRAGAITAMRQALDRFRIDGIRHNIDFLAALMMHSRFMEGALTTEFIADEYPDGFRGAPLDESRAGTLAAIAFYMRQIEADRAAACDQRLYGTIHNPPKTLIATIDNFTIELTQNEHGILVNDMPVHISSTWQAGDLFWHGKVNEADVSVAISVTHEGYILIGGGRQQAVSLRTPQAQALMQYMSEASGSADSDALLCPMPGVVVSVAIEVGDSVKAGMPLVVVEAMKMENILRAERDVTIKTICCAVGDKIAVDEVLIEFENETDGD